MASVRYRVSFSVFLKRHIRPSKVNSLDVSISGVINIKSIQGRKIFVSYFSFLIVFRERRREREDLTVFSQSCLIWRSSLLKFDMHAVFGETGQNRHGIKHSYTWDSYQIF